MTTRKTIGWLGAVLMAVGGVVRAAPPGRLHALIVAGDETSSSSVVRLKTSADARRLHAALTAPGSGAVPRSDATALLGRDVTATKVKLALHELRKLDPADRLIVVLAMPLAIEEGKAYFLPAEATEGAYSATALPVETVAKFLDRIPAKTQTVLLACRLAPKPAGKLDEWLKPLAGNNRAVGLAPCDGPLPGQFVDALAEGLAGPADADADHAVTLAELWTHAAKAVSAAAKKQPDAGLHAPALLGTQALPAWPLSRQRDAAKDQAALKKLHADEQITDEQYALGQRVLAADASAPAVVKAQRTVYLDLIDGRLPGRYLAAALTDAVRRAREATPTTAPADKPTLAVVPFRVLNKLRVANAGDVLAESLLPHFGKTYTLVDRGQLKAFLDQDDLTVAGLVELAEAGKQSDAFKKAVQLKHIRYLVVGSISALDDGSLMVVARISDWQTGRIVGNQARTIRGEDFTDIVQKLPDLAGLLTGRTTTARADDGTDPLTPTQVRPANTNELLIREPVGATLILGGKRHLVRARGTSLYLGVGKYPFELRMSSRQKVYGVLEVLLVNDDTRSIVFGAVDSRKIFRDTHVRAALQGRPVAYSIRVTDKSGATKTAIRYRMGLRPIE